MEELKAKHAAVETQCAREKARADYLENANAFNNCESVVEARGRA